MYLQPVLNLLNPGQPLLGGESSPLDFADLEIWGDAFDTSTIVDAGGGEVSDWTLKTNTAGTIVATQGTASARPNIDSAGGIPSLFFDSNDVLNALGISTPMGSTTTFATFTSTIAAGVRYVFNTDEGATTSVNYINRTTADIVVQSLVSAGSNSNMTLSGAVSDNVTISVIARHVDSGTSDMVDSNGLTTTDALVGTLRPTITDLFVGARTSGAANGWLGHIHEFGLYSRVLTNAEVTALMNSLKSRAGL